MPLIEFTPGYQCLKEASPPLSALPGCSFPLQEGRIWNLASISSSCDFLPETQDMEIDRIQENEIGAGSNLDQNLEQER